jgi:RNA polymerase-binding transcription factor DksA
MTTRQAGYFETLLIEERAHAEAAHEGDLIVAVDEALDQLHTDPSQYGICAKCGRAIDPDRLRIVPATKYCEDDAERKPFAWTGSDAAW